MKRGKNFYVQNVLSHSSEDETSAGVLMTNNELAFGVGRAPPHRKYQSTSAREDYINTMLFPYKDRIPKKFNKDTNQILLLNKMLRRKLHKLQDRNNVLEQ
jgi:hypothetical protein